MPAFVPLPDLHCCGGESVAACQRTLSKPQGLVPHVLVALRLLLCVCVRTQFQFFARNWVQTRGKALFFMALALLFDIALLLTLFLRILVFKSSISFSDVHILFDALVLSVLVVAFLVSIVDMNETTQKDHVHILEAQVRMVSACSWFAEPWA
jgi:hypothetical protein